jgi:hypothetical protein
VTTSSARDRHVGCYRNSVSQFIKSVDHSCQTVVGISVDHVVDWTHDGDIYRSPRKLNDRELASDSRGEGGAWSHVFEQAGLEKAYGTEGRGRNNLYSFILQYTPFVHYE